ncbi:MAG: MFS transporter [Candidatus Hodarchaeales archaeon]
MFFTSFQKIFGTEKINKVSQSFVLRTFSVNYLFVFLISLTDAFFIIQASESVGLKELTILLAILFLSKALLDFPAGIIADWIGQKSSLVISAILFALSYYQISLAENFSGFTLAFLALGFAEALQSDTFFNWFDNKYKEIVVEDTEWTIYSKIISRYSMVEMFVLASAYIIGAQLVATFTRSRIFLYQSVLFLLLIFLFLLVIRDYKIDKTAPKAPRIKLSEIVKGAFAYSFKNRIVFLFLLGSAITGVAIVYWDYFLSILLYKELVHGSDNWIGVAIAIEYFIAGILTGLLGILTNKIIKFKRWLILSLLIAFPLFFGGIYLFIRDSTLSAEFFYIDLAKFFILFTVITIPYYFYKLLNYRLLIDIIPDEFRSSIYSLLTSITFIFGSIVIFLGSETFSVSLEISFYWNTIIATVGAFLIIFILFFYKPSSRSIHPYSFFNTFLINRKLGISNVVHVLESKELKKYKKEIESISNRLMKVALEDGQLTEEELMLIDQITTGIQGYTMFLQSGKVKSLGKGQYQQELAILKDKIWKNAQNLVMTNQSLSEENSKLLIELKSIMDESEIFN